LKDLNQQTDNFPIHTDKPDPKPSQPRTPPLRGDLQKKTVGTDLRRISLSLKGKKNSRVNERPTANKKGTLPPFRTKWGGLPFTRSLRAAFEGEENGRGVRKRNKASSKARSSKGGKNPSLRNNSLLLRHQAKGLSVGPEMRNGGGEKKPMRWTGNLPRGCAEDPRARQSRDNGARK